MLTGNRKWFTAVSVRLSKTMIVLCLMGVGALGIRAEETAPIDRIVAVVNDDIIVLSELDHAVEPYRERVKSLGYSFDKEQEALYGAREKVLDQLIEAKLRDQEIARNEIVVEQKEVDDAVENVKKESLFTDEELREALAQEGMTLEDYTKQIREEILRSRLINLKVRSQIIITEEDIKAYYERHQDKYGSKTNYHLRHILLKIPPLADGKQDEAIKGTLSFIQKRLQEGQSFEALAKVYSESPTADGGGDLGVFKLDSLASQIREAIVTLKPGENTPVIDTDQGYQIFMLQDIIEEPGADIEDVRPEIEDALYSEVIAEKYESWIETLREQAHIKIIR